MVPNLTRIGASPAVNQLSVASCACAEILAETERPPLLSLIALAILWISVLTRLLLINACLWGFSTFSYFCFAYSLALLIVVTDDNLRRF